MKEQPAFILDLQEIMEEKLRMKNLKVQQFDKYLTQLFGDDNLTEITFPENIPREFTPQLINHFLTKGLYCKGYQIAAQFYKVTLSKEPLPKFRIEHDQLKKDIEKIIVKKSLDTSILTQELNKAMQQLESFIQENQQQEDFGKSQNRSWFKGRSVGEKYKKRPMNWEKIAQKSQQQSGMIDFRNRLPVYEYRQQFLEAVQKYQVVLVSGGTGTGKSTQLPQFILEHEANMGTLQSIVCTQPRQISAISVSTRIAHERGQTLGQQVGYQIKLQKKRNKDTQLIFCTTGSLLIKIQGDRLLSDIKYLIIDEIHERNIDEDLLLVYVKSILEQRPDLKLILMSATLQSSIFEEYFDSCYLLDIPGRTYPVESRYLEDILQEYGVDPVYRATNTKTHLQTRTFIHQKRQDPPAGSDTTQPQYRPDVIKAIQDYGEHNHIRSMDALAAQVIYKIHHKQPEGAILCFLNGWVEIIQCRNFLRILDQNEELAILPLHSRLPQEQQVAIFEPPPQGQRKVILSTVIAQTSITVNDVVYIVDGGMNKQTDYDPVNRHVSLNAQWISKSTAMQRQGRAGRVQAGICYKLYTKSFHDQSLRQYDEPEILKMPLEDALARIKSWGIENCENFLAKALTRPSKAAIIEARDILISAAIFDDEEKLTSLGQIAGRVATSPRIAKMLIMGTILRNLDPVLTLAVALTTKCERAIFVKDEEKTYRVKGKFTNALSDQIMIVKVFKEFQAAREQGEEYLDAYCHHTQLNKIALYKIDEARNQFLDSLIQAKLIQSNEDREKGEAESKSKNTRQKGYQKEVDFIDMADQTWEQKRIMIRNKKQQLVQEYSQRSGSIALLRTTICAALYPNVASITFDPRGASRKLLFKTANHGIVRIDLSSSLEQKRTYQEPWIVYNEVKDEDKIYLAGNSMVHGVHLMICGGDLKPTEHLPEGFYSQLKGLAHFRCEIQDAKLIMAIRDTIQKLMTTKIIAPKAQTSPMELLVAKAIQELTGQSEKQRKDGAYLI